MDEKNKDTARRVVNLQARNVMRLKAVDVTPPHAGVFGVGGKNEQGKTTLLQCVQMACAGKGAIPGEPLRRGARKGEITLDLGDIRIVRTFSENDSHLKVERSDGSRVASPQALLDQLYNKVAFDPTAFSRMSTADQVATLRKIVGMDETLDIQEGRAVEERKVLKRELSAVEAKLIGRVFHTDAPATEPSMAKLAEQYREATEAQSRYEDLGVQAERQSQKVDTIQGHVDELRRKLATAEADLAEAQTESERLVHEILAFPPFTNPDGIKAQMEKVEEIARRVRYNTETNKLCEERMRLKNAVDDAEAAVESVRNQKKELLEAAQLPVDGLAFDESGVTLGGIPFAQCSAAQRIKASVAIAIAMNPNLRVALVRDGSLLDEDSMAQLQAMALEMDVQLWVERVGEDEHCSVIIEDGEIKS